MVNRDAGFVAIGNVIYMYRTIGLHFRSNDYSHRVSTIKLFLDSIQLSGWPLKHSHQPVWLCSMCCARRAVLEARCARDLLCSRSTVLEAPCARSLLCSRSTVLGPLCSRPAVLEVRCAKSNATMLGKNDKSDPFC